MNFKFAIAASAVMALASIFTAGCGGDACTKAADQLTACGIKGDPATTGSMQASCTGTLMCSSDCINNASCDALVDAFTSGMPGDKSTAFLKCTSACTTPK